MTRQTLNQSHLGSETQARTQAVEVFVSSVAQLARDAAAGYRRWRLTQQTRQDLDRLPDRLLRDIGISRGEIDGLARSLAAQEVDGKRAGESDSRRAVGRHPENAALVGCG